MMTSRLGTNDIHYSIAVVNATDTGLMARPTGAGFIWPAPAAGIQPEAAVDAIWRYLAPRLVSLSNIAAGASNLRRG
jgi:TRAP-type C4-dicarboxylate transport system permease large subunit